MKTESYQYLSELVLREYTIAEPIFWFTSVIAGILMCKIFYNATKILTPLYFKGYHKLTKAEQIEWNNRGFSTAHAVLVSVVSIYLLFVSDIFRDNVQDGPVTLRNSPFSTFILGVKQILPVGFYSLFMAPPLLAMMNIFWFWRITKGLKKTLSKRA